MKKAIRKAMVILAIIFALIIGSSVLLSTLNMPLDRSNATLIDVTVEEGATTDDIANALKDAGVIRSTTRYKICSKIWHYDSNYKAGVYSVSPSMTCSDIAKVIVSGKETTNSFTVPEGSTIETVAETLAKDGLVDKKKFLEAAQNSDAYSDFDFLKDAQKGKNHLEGYLFPSTYQVAPKADEQQIITTMLNQFDTVFTDEYKARAKKLGYTENQIIIIASIIEKEAQVDEDRPKIASVIYNRLDDGMNLQMCSTVQYILGKAKPVLSVADTKIDSPYNTYIHSGLPKGPICSPGEASIKAALYPAKTDYMYFVVSEKLDGSHNFSKSYSKFEKDTRAYEKALAKENRK